MRFCTLLVVLVACQVPDGADATGRHRPHPDASVPARDAAPDAASTGGGGSGTVSCYTEGDPGQTCTLPVHCCFTGYTSSHDGYCTTETCAFGTITCDGPEDCASGSSCCAHAITVPDDGTIGYDIACRAGGCGSDVELCHTTCSGGRACVSAYGHDNDLPRTLDICQ